MTGGVIICFLLSLAAVSCIPLEPRIFGEGETTAAPNETTTPPLTSVVGYVKCLDGTAPLIALHGQPQICKTGTGKSYASCPPTHDCQDLDGRPGVCCLKKGGIEAVGPPSVSPSTGSTSESLSTPTAIPENTTGNFGETTQAENTTTSQPATTDSFSGESSNVTSGPDATSTTPASETDSSSTGSETPASSTEQATTGNELSIDASVSTGKPIDVVPVTESSTVGVSSGSGEITSTQPDSTNADLSTAAPDNGAIVSTQSILPETATAATEIIETESSTSAGVNGSIVLTPTPANVPQETTDVSNTITPVEGLNPTLSTGSVPDGSSTVVTDTTTSMPDNSVTDAAQSTSSDALPTVTLSLSTDGPTDGSTETSASTDAGMSGSSSTETTSTASETTSSGASETTMSAVDISTSEPSGNSTGTPTATSEDISSSTSTEQAATTPVACMEGLCSTSSTISENSTDIMNANGTSATEPAPEPEPEPAQTNQTETSSSTTAPEENSTTPLVNMPDGEQNSTESFSSTESTASSPAIGEEATTAAPCSPGMEELCGLSSTNGTDGNANSTIEVPTGSTDGNHTELSTAPAEETTTSGAITESAVTTEQPTVSTPENGTSAEPGEQSSTTGPSCAPGMETACTPSAPSEANGTTTEMPTVEGNQTETTTVSFESSSSPAQPGSNETTESTGSTEAETTAVPSSQETASPDSAGQENTTPSLGDVSWYSMFSLQSAMKNIPDAVAFRKSTGPAVVTSGQFVPCTRNSDCFSLREPVEWCQRDSFFVWTDKSCFCAADTEVRSCIIERFDLRSKQVQWTFCTPDTQFQCAYKK